MTRKRKVDAVSALRRALDHENDLREQALNQPGVRERMERRDRELRGIPPVDRPPVEGPLNSPKKRRTGIRLAGP